MTTPRPEMAPAQPAAGRVRGWRALPPPLALALGMALISALGMALEARHGWRPIGPTMPPAVIAGMAVATRVLELYALIVLARRNPGATRTGLAVYLVSTMLSLTLWLGWELVMMLGTWSIYTDGVTYLRLAGGLVTLLGSTGLMLALWPHGRGRAISALVLSIAIALIPAILPMLAQVVPFGGFSLYLLSSAASTISEVALLVWVFSRITGESPPPSAAQIASGLRHAGYALRMIVFLMMGTLLLSISPGGVEAPDALISFVYVADLWLGAVAIGWLGISLARAAVVPGGEPNAYWLGIAGLLVVVCSGGMLFGALMQSAHWLGYDNPSATASWSTASVLLLAPLAGTVLAAAIAQFASRRGLDVLRRRATAVAIGMAALFVPVLFAGDTLLALSPRFAILAAGLVLAAGLLLASICKATAQAIDHTRGDLPVARVVA